MALSNWDSLSVSFRIVQRRINPGDANYTPQMQAAQDKLNEFFCESFPDPPKFPPQGELYDQCLVFQKELDELIIDHKVEVFPCNGVFVHEESDLHLEIYKNWVYLRSGGMLLTVEEGRFTKGVVNVEVSRGPQNGAYALCYHSQTEEDDIGLYTVYSGMVGCGVYGYEDAEPGQGDDGYDFRFVGVKPESVKWFQQWLHNSKLTAAGKINLADVKRFNQGDQYLAGIFGIDTPTTAVGDAENTLLSDAIKGMNQRLDSQAEDED